MNELLARAKADHGCFATASSRRGGKWLLPAVLLSAFALGACGGSDDEDESATEEPVKSASDASASTEAVTVPAESETLESAATVVSDARSPSSGVELVVASGFSSRVESGTRNSSAAAVVTNPSSDEAACDVQVTFTLQDASGASVDTVTEHVAWIPKSAQAIVAPVQIGFDIAQEPTALAVSTVAGSFRDTDDLAGCETFTMESGVLLDVVTSEVVRDDFWTEVNGQVTNSSDQLVDMAFLDCVVRTGDAIVGGASTAVLDPVQPGQTIAFSSGPISGLPDTANTAQCQLAASTTS